MKLKRAMMAKAPCQDVCNNVACVLVISKK